MAQRRPNIIWFFDDQHRAQATSLAGDPNVRTPHIDRLARQGVWFRRALSGCPWCAPFRGSLLTGWYPNRNVYRTPMRMDPSIPTIAHTFTAAGYDTAYIGKWHLDRPTGQDPPMMNGEPRHTAHFVAPERRGGFASWLGYESNSRPYDTWLHGHASDGQEIDLHPLGKYETDGLSDLLVDYLHGRASGGAGNEPFFAVCSIQPPHDPYNPPDKWLAARDPATLALRPNVPQIESVREEARAHLAGYYGSVECVDENLGRVMRALAQTGLDENTYLFFFSDHGDMHWSHGYFGKSMPWEESIRIPFIIGGGAARSAAGRATDAILNSVDIAPTTLGLCGLDIPNEMQGFDYSPYVTGSGTSDPLPGEPDSALCQHIVPKRHANGMECTWRGVVTRDGWKYTCSDLGPLGMFNLGVDPYEQHNLAYDHTHRERRRLLIDRLRRWLHVVDDEFPLPHHD